MTVTCEIYAGQQIVSSMTHDGNVREWLLNVPPGYDGASAIPLVVCLHGTGGNYSRILDNGWVDTSDAETFLLALPNGGIYVQETGGWKWNTYKFPATLPDDVGFLELLIENLKANYVIDASRVYMTGHSNGASMTNSFAFYHSDVLAAIAPVNGAWMTTLGIDPYTVYPQPNAPLPVWIWRGELETFQTGLETRDVQDQKQKQYWTNFHLCSPTPDILNESDATYTYTTQVYSGGTAEVRFTETAGQSHTYRSEYTYKIWHEFFVTKVLIADINQPFLCYDMDEVTMLARGAVNGVNVAAAVPGFELLFLKDGKTIYHQAFGSWQKGNLANIDSSTKTISGAVIASLIDNCANVFSLTTRLSEYIPEFNGSKSEITIGQCFSHAAGFGGSTAISNPAITLYQAALDIADDPLAWRPGLDFSYGGVSMQAAGAVAEIAEGKSWNTIFSERIAQPLGLIQTRYVLSGPNNPRIAGGVKSTGAEFAKFMEMLRCGGRYNDVQVLSQAAVQALLFRQTDPEVVLINSPLGDSTDYGVGIWLDQRDSEGNLTGALAGGARGFCGWIDIDDGITGVLATDKTTFKNIEQLQYLIREACERAVRNPVLCGDVNRSGMIDFEDFAVLANNFLKDEKLMANGDVNGDGIVSYEDVSRMALNWINGI